MSYHIFWVIVSHGQVLCEGVRKIIIQVRRCQVIKQEISWSVLLIWSDVSVDLLQQQMKLMQLSWLVHGLLMLTDHLSRDLQIVKANFSCFCRLGEDKGYKQYVNHYAENTLALNKYQHKEERDRERYLSYKFSLSDAGEFKWMGGTLGTEVNSRASNFRYFLRHTVLNLNSAWGYWYNNLPHAQGTEIKFDDSWSIIFCIATPHKWPWHVVGWWLAKGLSADAALHTFSLVSHAMYTRRASRYRLGFVNKNWSWTWSSLLMFLLQSVMLDTLRNTLLHLEHQIPLCFMHSKWSRYRNAWGKIVMACNSPQVCVGVKSRRR